jgi:hypothetical protein
VEANFLWSNGLLPLQLAVELHRHWIQSNTLYEQELNEYVPMNSIAQTSQNSTRTTNMSQYQARIFL